VSPRESKEYDPNVDSPVSFEAEPLGEDESLVAGGYRRAGAMVVHRSVRLVPKKQGMFSDLGEVLMVEPDTFQPLRNLYDVHKDTQVVRTLRVECPGVLESDINWEHSDQGVTLEVRKRKFVKGAVEPCLPLRQHAGKYMENFVFPGFDFCDDSLKLEKGVLEMTWVKTKGVRKGTLGRVPSIQHFNLTPRYVADDESSSLKESSSEGVAADLSGIGQMSQRSFAQSPHSMSAPNFGERPPTRREMEPPDVPSFEPTSLSAGVQASFVQHKVAELEERMGPTPRGERLASFGGHQQWESAPTTPAPATPGRSLLEPRIPEISSMPAAPPLSPTETSQTPR
jgi:HSP20 family molecular chaperone IbpA